MEIFEIKACIIFVFSENKNNNFCEIELTKIFNCLKYEIGHQAGDALAFFKIWSFFIIGILKENDAFSLLAKTFTLWYSQSHNSELHKPFRMYLGSLKRPCASVVCIEDRHNLSWSHNWGGGYKTMVGCTTEGV